MRTAPIRTLATAALALAALAPIAVAAPAAARGERTSIAIPTADLNLATAAGQRQLDRRIRHAGTELCATGIRSVAAMAREQACMADVRAQAEAQLDGVTSIALTRPRPRG